MKGSNVLRPPGLVVFAVLLLVIVLLWLLFADRLVQRAVESTGESLVGARVDLESVDLSVSGGSVRMTGLEVANPDAPMTNLVEAGEIVVDLLLEPLLEKKVVVQRMSMTDIRFNTPRETSGALENPSPESGALWRQVNDWASRIDIPELSFESLTGVIRTEAISADSLRTVQYAREAVAKADSMRADWEARVTALDPRPRIDTLQAVAERLEGFRPTPLNALQVPALIEDARRALGDVTSLQTEVAALDDAVRNGIGSLGLGTELLDSLRAADLAYARSLLDIPSLDAPTISPALFGETALSWMRPVLYWAQTVERYLPPGLDPRRRPGPRRARAEGTTVEFPGRATYPAFWLQEGELGLEIGGSGLAAGAYTALVSGVSTAPSLVDVPVRLELAREGAAQGPRGLSLSAMLDHTAAPVRDSVVLGLSGLELPRIDIPPIGGALDLGAGESSFTLSRVGREIDARLHWVSEQVGWVRAAAPPATPATLGSAEWARELIWRTLEGVERVELTLGLAGDLESPRLTVESNVAGAVAESLRRELGAQLEEAEARLRAEVDSRIQPLLQDARSRVDALRSGVAAQVAEQRQALDEARRRIEERIEELTSGIPGGLPGLDG
jgi:uncharacterized protein (TIGR03545 family)